MIQRPVIAASLLLLSALALQRCSPRPSASPASSTEAAFTPVLSVKELMEHVIDPVADWVFDAAVIDVSAKGIVETIPLTDDDWLRVERGAMILAESANLLKMTRAMVPAGDKSLEQEPGGPELTPGEIETKVKNDPGQWRKQADLLRVAALESLAIARARDAKRLFDAGDKIDKACESCHLEFWYPGDKKLVLENQGKTVTYDKSTP